MNSWAETDRLMRLVEKALVKGDPDPKALACYGLLVRGIGSQMAWEESIWLRFVAGNPNSLLSEHFLTWCCEKLQALEKSVLVLIWDHASWHISRATQTWIREHNHQVKKSSQGVRILSCLLPKKSLWLNPIETMWIHGKRRVVELERVFSPRAIVERVCDTFGIPIETLLNISNNVP